MTPTMTEKGYGVGLRHPPSAGGRRGPRRRQVGDHALLRSVVDRIVPGAIEQNTKDVEQAPGLRSRGGLGADHGCGPGLCASLATDDMCADTAVAPRELLRRRHSASRPSDRARRRLPHAGQVVAPAVFAPRRSRGPAQRSAGFRAPQRRRAFAPRGPQSCRARAGCFSRVSDCGSVCDCPMLIVKWV